MGLVDISTLDKDILVELRYATTNNFMQQNIYGELRKAYFVPHFARKIAQAQQILRQRKPGYRLLIYDAARPQSAQRRMRQAVEGTPYTAYVAEASRGGRHNFGVAVDLTIADKDGRPLDMGAPFDHFGREAWIGDGRNTTLQHFKAYIAQMQKQGIISAEAAANRTLLVEIMDAVGLRPYAKEWWHYQERVSMSRTREIYKLLDF
ncbi:MAG: M15 family metallopeptidase [Alistipes sp.]|nr:M15 family metallopeptidase [Alistipes sp.]